MQKVNMNQLRSMYSVRSDQLYITHSNVIAHCAEHNVPLPSASFTAPGFSAVTQNGRQLCCLLAGWALRS